MKRSHSNPYFDEGNHKTWKKDTSMGPRDPYFKELALLLDNPGWPHILSYLSLGDLESFGQGHCILSIILNEYLEQPGKIVVDQETLWKFPMETNFDVYCRYRFSTKLEYNGIPDRYLLMSFRYFPNIQEMTLRNMKMRYFYVSSLPLWGIADLRKLSVINSSGPYGCLKGYSGSSLHLEGNSEMSIEIECPNIESLTLINEVMHYNSQSPFELLKKLTIDYSWRTLQYDWYKEFPKLDQLTVLRSVDWKTMSEIEALQLKSVQVQHYFEAPTEENLILKLNDDCLYHLQSFLNADDWISLYQTNTRFQNLRILKYQIDSVSLQRFPCDHAIYKRIGRLVTRLHIYCHRKDYRALLPHFTNLSDLDIYGTFPLDNRILTLIPAGLTKLSLEAGFPKNAKQLKVLFRRLNPTLRNVTLEDVDEKDLDYGRTLVCTGLDQLRKIEQLTCLKLKVTPEFLKCLRLNKDHLTSLKLKLEEVSSELWPHITEMPNITRLYVDTCSPYVKIPKAKAGALAKLKDLTIRGFEINAKDFLFSLDTTNLSTFCYSGPNIEYYNLLFPRMTSLTELFNEFRHYSGQSTIYSLMPAIFVLTKLEKLTAIPLEESMVVPLVKGLPQLTYLDTQSTKLEANTIMEVKRVAKMTQRDVDIRYTEVIQ